MGDEDVGVRAIDVPILLVGFVLLAGTVKVVSGMRLVSCEYYYSLQTRHDSVDNARSPPTATMALTEGCHGRLGPPPRAMRGGRSPLPVSTIVVVVGVVVFSVVVAVGTLTGRWLGALVFHAAPDHPEPVLLCAALSGVLVSVVFIVEFSVVVTVGTCTGRWLGALVFHAAPDHP